MVFGRADWNAANPGQECMVVTIKAEYDEIAFFVPKVRAHTFAEEFDNLARLIRTVCWAHRDEI